jgi:hypothetical protein
VAVGMALSGVADVPRGRRRCFVARVSQNKNKQGVADGVEVIGSWRGRQYGG